MKSVSLVSVCVLATWMFQQPVWAAGADHPHPVTKGDGGWPDAYYEIFNRKDRVHGYFVNSGDVFFYAADSKRFNTFLLECSELEDTSLELILHVGRKKARSPWDKKDRDIDVDWRLLADRGRRTGGKAELSFMIQIDVWLGGAVSLDELQIPTNITVRSAGEIDLFIWEHEKKQNVGTAREGKEEVSRWILEQKVKLMLAKPPYRAKLFKRRDIIDAKIDAATGYRIINGELWGTFQQCASCEKWIPTRPSRVTTKPRSHGKAETYACPLCGKEAN